MKTYDVILVKSYIVKIKATSQEKAKRHAELFTDDIKDISSCFDRKRLNFKIEEIKCSMNETF